MPSERLEGESKAQYVKRLVEESLPSDVRDVVEVDIVKENPLLTKYRVRRKISERTETGGAVPNGS